MEGPGRKLMWHIYRYYPVIYMERLMKNFRRGLVRMVLQLRPKLE
jgi:hypothetical protein